MSDAPAPAEFYLLALIQGYAQDYAVCFEIQRAFKKTVLIIATMH